ncbi:HIT domain-containing protein [Candidatus Mycosynbacter amalyticus]|uniref:HIT domain-containing protein n=1 Tax=Candidatus Mycosynbacter amalyticus TaxID=2665156 RepID=A0A857MI87_9BACT|nr:HIT domain-containing protein [Candidatus Mycosynbacter amalyticus]QHN42276.1 HIT domain-containing protein [Candidatus Mycosynbacter amalyticus]
MNESIFTKIINGDIPSYKIYEDEHTYAFLDIHPIASGHTLVVPKQQVEFVWDLDTAAYQALQASVQKIARHLRTTLNVPYVGEQIIGVDVPHAHIHLIPFTDVSQYRHMPDMTAEPDHVALSEIAAQLRFS